ASFGWESEPRWLPAHPQQDQPEQHLLDARATRGYNVLCAVVMITSVIYATASWRGWMKWVTRARPKIDRVACPWLIQRFVDPQAEFLYVSPEQVLAVAEREDATPFDVAGVELGHHGAECSFDAIIRKYNLSDPALQRLAPIVRATL